MFHNISDQNCEALASQTPLFLQTKATEKVIGDLSRTVKLCISGDKQHKTKQVLTIRYREQVCLGLSGHTTPGNGKPLRQKP